MSNALAGLRRDRAKASDRMNELATAARGRSMTDDEQRDFDAAAREVKDLDGKITAAEAEETTKAGSALSRVDAAEIVRLCTNGGVPMMAATLIAENASVDEAKKRVEAAGKAAEIVALARRKEPSIPADLAATMLAAGKTVEEIRTACFEKIVAKEDETKVSSHVPAALGNAGATASAASMQRELKRAGLSQKEA